MKDQWTERLSAYLDGELAESERVALEAHLPGCPDCATALKELRAVIARAASLDDRPPARDLWRGIAARIGAARPAPRAVARVRRFPRVSLSLPQLAAAAVAVMLVSGAVVARWARSGAPAGPMVSVPAGPGAYPVLAVAAMGGPGYDSAVVVLERALAEGRGRLDTLTIRVIEDNLAIIDRAIEQARRALTADPGSVYLNTHLAGTLKRKVELLRRVTQLTAQS